MMKRVAFAAACAAFLAVGTFPTHASEDDAKLADALSVFASGPDIRPGDIQELAKQVLGLAETGQLASIGSRFSSSGDAKGVEMDGAINMLSEALLNPETKDLLEELEADPESAMKKLMESPDGQVSPVQAILLYLASLKDVLRDNQHLLKQIGKLIEAETEALVTSNATIDDVLGSITRSDAFQDLTEEIEENIQKKTGVVSPVVLGGEEDGDMGR